MRSVERCLILLSAWLTCLDFRRYLVGYIITGSLRAERWRERGRRTVALLKDADALDRIRLDEDNLKVEMLRLPETVGLVDYATRLYYETVDGKERVFSDYLFLAYDLLR